MGLLTNIQQDLVSSKSATMALRKALILAYNLDNHDFKTWVLKELNGFPWENGVDFESYLISLPDYRKAQAVIRGILTNGYWITQNGLLHFPDAPKEIQTIWLENGIASLERLLENNHETFRHKFAGREINYFNNLTSNPDVSVADAWKEIPRHFILNAIEAVKDRLLLFTLELKQMYPSIDNENATSQTEISNERISHLVQNTIYQLYEGASMTTFDQRNQQVQGNQYNAAGNINFLGSLHPIEFAEELENAKRSLSQLTGEEIDVEVATEIEYQLTKAIQQSKEETSDKATILTHLGKVKALAANIGGLAGFIVAIDKAIQVVDKII